MGSFYTLWKHQKTRGFQGCVKRPMAWNRLTELRRLTIDIFNWVRVFRNGPSKISGRQPFKNLKWYGLPRQTISLQMFKRLSSTNFTWSILEYLDPNVASEYVRLKMSLVLRNYMELGTCSEKRYVCWWHRPVTLLKKDSIEEVFIWNLECFLE